MRLRERHPVDVVHAEAGVVHEVLERDGFSPLGRLARRSDKPERRASLREAQAS